MKFFRAFLLLLCAASIVGIFFGAYHQVFMAAMAFIVYLTLKPQTNEKRTSHFRPDW